MTQSILFIISRSSLHRVSKGSYHSPDLRPQIAGSKITRSIGRSNISIRSQVAEWSASGCCGDRDRTARELESRREYDSKYIHLSQTRITVHYRRIRDANRGCALSMLPFAFPMLHYCTNRFVSLYPFVNAKNEREM